MDQAVVREQARVPAMTAAALMFAGSRRLGAIIVETQVSRAMLRRAAELLREAARDVEKIADYAFDLVPAVAAPPLYVEAAAKLLAASMFEGPLPPLPGSMDAARKIVGHLSAVLPPAEYLNIDESKCYVASLAPVFFDASHHLFVCAGILGLTATSPRWQRWRGRMVLATAQSDEAVARLATADLHAVEAHWILRNLCKYWDPHRAEDPSSAEENLRDAMNLMDQALVAMRQMHDAVTRQSYETLMIFR